MCFSPDPPPPSPSCAFPGGASFPVRAITVATPPTTSPIPATAATTPSTSRRDGRGRSADVAGCGTGCAANGASGAVTADGSGAVAASSSVTISDTTGGSHWSDPGSSDVNRLSRAGTDGRALASRSKQLATGPASAPGSRLRSGASCRIWDMVSSGVSPPNGLLPTAAKWSTQPREKTSLAGVTAPPSTCSGDMYATVSVPGSETIVAVEVCSSARARPKSITRGPSAARMMLSGVRLRCTTCAPWIDARPSSRPVASRPTAVTGSGPSATASRSVGPGM